MTTTDLYSGYTADGKPSSRVLRPPGGGSSNIFGGAEPEAPREQVRREMAQQSPATQTQSPSNPTTDANNEYQKNKPKGKAEAPFAMFQESGKHSAPSQFDKCDTESQNDADFRCYSVTEYRNAVATNAAIRQKAHGAATGAFNPITHEENQGSSGCKEYDQRKIHPQQVIRNQQNQEQPVRMVRGQGNNNTGKVQYNPITGEEYPADYGQQKGEEKEEQEKNEDEETEKDKDESTDSPTDENNSATEQQEATPAPVVETTPAPFQKVRQPPGGKSSGLW
ncbi:microtubule-associated protein Jupiter-like isoform X2 [Ruditapes philippinarum]|uniref:microtubule-associated protein Jupiter-like isoform X2 n=1 Tax=Ruditapes philippinarum TaxID=129788 RepID=UPI00295BD7E4|nr:microtubule-associated protein Jupiter-like isoform X2 [Ruditapes philippinarum]